MKKFFKIIFYLFLFFVGFNLIWFGYNLRPRPAEKELWSPTELALPTGYSLYSPKDFLKALHNPENDEWNIPEALEDLRQYKNPPAEFWQKAQALKNELSKYLATKKESLNSYEKLLDGPEWIDPRPIETSLDPKTPQANVMHLMNMHRVAGLQMVDLSLKGDWDALSAFWLKVFHKDLVWLYYARSVISRMAALDCVYADIQLLSLIQQKHALVDQVEIQKALASIDWEKLSFKRSIIAEYLYETYCLDLVLNEDLPKTKDYRFRKIFFNRNATLKLINDRFIQYEKFLQNPSAIPKNFDEKMDVTQRLPKSGNWFWDTFWWIDNPGGKLITNLLFVNTAEYIKEYASRETELAKTVPTLLKRTETQSMSMQSP